jgi:hypothetical protein
MEVKWEVSNNNQGSDMYVSGKLCASYRSYDKVNYVIVYKQSDDVVIDESIPVADLGDDIESYVEYRYIQIIEHGVEVDSSATYRLV